MWEVRWLEWNVGKSLRITPTYVGSTLLLHPLDVAQQDHPHVCGKYKID